MGVAVGFGDSGPAFFGILGREFGLAGVGGYGHYAG